MSEDSNTTELLDDPSSKVLSWIFGEKGGSLFNPNSYHHVVKQEVESSDESSCESSSDSSSIICLEELQKCDEEAVSSPKKIKLENVTQNESANVTLPHQVLEIHAQNPCSSLDGRPDDKSENRSLLSGSSGTSENCFTNEASIETTPDLCSTVKFTSVKRLTRDELEMIIVKQMVDAITADKRISLLEEKLEVTEKMLKISTEKTAKLTQEVSASDMILRKFLTQVQNGQAKIYHPPKKTMRTVGVQVKQGSRKKVMKVVESKATTSSVTRLPNDTGKSATTAINTSKKESGAAKNDSEQNAADRSKEKKTKNDTRSPNLKAALPSQANADTARRRNAMNSREGDTDNIPFNIPALPHTASGSVVPLDPSWKPMPPKLSLRISKIALSLHFTWYWFSSPSVHADIECYQIWGYSKSSCPTDQWELLAELPPGPLPMSSQIDGSKWAEKLKTPELGVFVIRGIDIHGRNGPWSDPAAISFP